MARRFHYYNVFITHNNTATTLYFTDFLHEVMKIDWANRIRKINYHPTAIFELSFPGPGLDDTCRVAAIGKYRQQVKPYIGDINTNQAKMIENDIIEMVTIVAAPLTRTVLVEFNFYGSKAKDIEDYFNSFFPRNNPGEQWAISFVPVDSDKSISDIKSSNDIKEVTLKMNVETNDFATSLSRAQNPTERNTLFGSIMSLMNKIQDDTDAPVVDLSFGKGRKRKLDLDASEILKLISSLNIDDNESILSCRVKYRNTASGKYEPIELKNAGIMNDVVLEEDKSKNHGWLFVGNEILQKYIQRNRRGSAASRKITYIDKKGLPKLMNEPSEQYLVPVQGGKREDLEDVTA